MRKLYSLLLALVVMNISFVYAAPTGVKFASGGEFKDSEGGIHAWRVNEGHTLVWDGMPYIPVGTVFYSKYITVEQTDAAWNEDIKTLDLLKAKGITDLLIKGILPLSKTKPDAWQKLLSYLDSNGFTYGIDVSDGPVAPLAGFIVDPTRYRVTDVTEGSKLSFDMPDTIAGLWMLCKTSDGSVITNGGVAVSNGKATVTVRGKITDTSVLLMYPVKELSNGGTDGVCDLWGGFDEYRDRLVKFLSQVKFGKGLRFFVDPVSSKMDFVGERVAIIPDSAEYRLEFEAFLRNKYHNIGSVTSAWRLKEETLSSFEQAARLLPLWRGSKGIPCVYDRARAQRYDIDTQMSKIWGDILEFRDSSAQNYLNAAADILKKNGANVPVIYRAKNLHRVLANSATKGGFDGLAVDTYGHGLDMVESGAGVAYSLAEESLRSMWFVASGTMDTTGRDKSLGYPNQQSMFADLDTLAEVGVKGVFVRGVQLPANSSPGFSIETSPDQLGWLKAFKDSYTSGDRMSFRPNVLYYAVDPVTGGEITRLSPNTWWLPSLKNGTPLYIGDGFGCYTLAGQQGICVWSKEGKSTLTFPITGDSKPYFMTPQGSRTPVAVEKKKAVFSIGETPILISGIDRLHPFPYEPVATKMAELSNLITKIKNADATAGKHVGISPLAAAENALIRAKDILKVGGTDTAFDQIRSYVLGMSADAGTYAWIEGESTVSHSFDAVKSSQKASSGGYLSLETTQRPQVSPYVATYMMEATREGAYEIWLAGLAPQYGMSAFSYSTDNGVWKPGVTSEPQSFYGKKFAWYKIGSVALTRGVHTIQIRIDTPSDGVYRFGIDALVVSPDAFQPNGINRPR